jgi:hypothetical protein
MEVGLQRQWQAAALLMGAPRLRARPRPSAQAAVVKEERVRPPRQQQSPRSPCLFPAAQETTHPVLSIRHTHVHVPAALTLLLPVSIAFFMLSSMAPSAVGAPAGWGRAPHALVRPHTQ